MSVQMQNLRNEEAAGNLQVDWKALWLNPTKYLTSIEKASMARGMYPTPPGDLASGWKKPDLQEALFWENWPGMQYGPGPDPTVYGSLDATSRWCNWMPFGPLPIQVMEPSYILTLSGHAVQLEKPPYTCLFDKTDCTKELIGEGTPYWARYGQVEGTPAPVQPYPNWDYWMGRKTYRYIVPVKVLFTFEKETPDGMLPYPVGAKQYDKTIKPGKIVGMHILSQVSQTTHGYFNITLPPIPFKPGDVEVGPPTTTLYETYFPVVLRAWPIIRKLVQQYSATLKFNLDKWVLACSTGDLPGLIPDDPVPCVLGPFLEAFTTASKIPDPGGDAILAESWKQWFTAHPEQGPSATAGGFRKWKYDNEFKPFLEAH